MTRADELQVSIQTYVARLARLRQQPDRNHVAIQQTEHHLETLRRRLRETEQT